MNIQSTNMLLSQALLAAAANQQNNTSTKAVSNQTFLTLLESILEQEQLNTFDSSQSSLDSNTFDLSFLQPNMSNLSSLQSVLQPNLFNQSSYQSGLQPTTYQGAIQSQPIVSPAASQNISSTADSSSLNQYLKGALQNSGSLFVEAGKTYGMDPALLAAISMHETGNGNSHAISVKHNPAGMMGKDGLKTYASLQDGIFDMARNLRQNYLDQGISTIADIGAKYAPIGAANDPSNLNSYWVNGVQSYYNQLTGKGTNATV